VVLFDFDGTLSLIRSGWVDVMVPMMVEILALFDFDVVWLSRVVAGRPSKRRPHSGDPLVLCEGVFVSHPGDVIRGPDCDFVLTIRINRLPVMPGCRSIRVRGERPMGPLD